MTIQHEDVLYTLFLVYDYVHIYKNLRNNWITETCKELSFTKDGKEYIACWSDMV